MVRRIACVAVIALAASGCELVVGDETRSVADAGDADAVVDPGPPAADASAPPPAVDAAPPPAVDAAADVCTAPPMCLTAATMCGQKCTQAWTMCDQKDCKDAACPTCNSQLAMCQSDCVAHCVSCSKCVETSACTSAVQQ